MKTSNEFLEEASGSNSKVKKVAKLLIGIRKYVAENVSKRLSIFLEAWEIVMDSGVMIGRIHSLREYLQRDL